MTLHRFSSRTKHLDTEFLAKSLTGARKYFRIAGYFQSSAQEAKLITLLKEQFPDSLEYAHYLKRAELRHIDD